MLKLDMTDAVPGRMVTSMYKALRNEYERAMNEGLTEAEADRAAQKCIGHWIPSHIPESILDECSECGFSCGAFTFNYCPNCGAKMESEVVVKRYKAKEALQQ